MPRAIKNQKYLRKVYKILFEPDLIALVERPSFNGWGMTTVGRPPWKDGGGHDITKDFSKVDALLKKLVQDGSFVLSQLKQGSSCTEIEWLNELNWRHYILYWSSTFAIKNTESKIKNIAECGVCDGLTIFYAINAVMHLNKTYRAYLYDAWDAMRDDLLMESEKGHSGDYGYLNLQATQKNLSIFDSNTLVFNKGYIPQSFQSANNPDGIVWLHIDLNSAKATIFALDFFWDKLENGGVIIFDDYGHGGYQDTQASIEEWINLKNGTFLHFPTGQAIIIKDQKLGVA